MAPEICPGCQQPITPAQWARAVRVTRDGQRAHLACLEVGWLATFPSYIVAKAATSPDLLVPGAMFVDLAGDVVLIGVPRAGLDAQMAALEAASAVPPPTADDRPALDWLFFSYSAAVEAIDPDAVTVRGIWGPDDVPW